MVTPNRAKAAAAVDGQLYLRDAFAAEQKVLALNLELSMISITHNGVMGEVNELHFVDFLRRHLPTRYAVDRGVVIDANGRTSDQIDIVIFDRQYTPTLLDQQSHRFIPAEAVYVVLEAKPKINKEYLEYAGEKARSVRILERTTVLAAGQAAAKQPFPIVGGIVAAAVDWDEGLGSEAFSSNLGRLDGAAALNCGIALSDRAFDTFEGKLTLSSTKGSLAFFLFRLLSQLQSLGTAPAVDWRRYAEVLGKAND
jgi:hypothetical protein